MFDKTGFLDALKDDKAFLNDVVNMLGDDIIAQSKILIYAETELDEDDFQVEFSDYRAKDYFDIYNLINQSFDNIIKTIDKSQNKRTVNAKKIFNNLVTKKIENPNGGLSSMEYIKEVNIAICELSREIKNKLSEQNEKTLYEVLEESELKNTQTSS